VSSSALLVRAADEENGHLCNAHRISLVLRGARAFQLFLQSWQFILWKQCHVLVHQKGLPAELWVST
jgi:hypothetical protein